MVEIKFGKIDVPQVLDIDKGGFNPARYNEQKIENSSALKDVLENLDRDVLEDDNLTSIDFNTRLTEDEIGNIVALQMMDVFKVGGSECSLMARTLKRHKVSLGGQGRKEKVQIAQGEREQEVGNKDTSLFGKIKGFMGGNKNEN
jgi:hypothetical protein